MSEKFYDEQKGEWVYVSGYYDQGDSWVTAKEVWEKQKEQYKFNSYEDEELDWHEKNNRENDEAITKQKLSKGLDSWTPTVEQKPVQEVKSDITPEMLAEAMEASQVVSKAHQEVQKKPILEKIEEASHMNDIHNIFKEKRFEQPWENGPRNFYDHAMSLDIKERYRAQININKAQNLQTTGDYRTELKKIDREDQKRVVGGVVDLNVDAYAIMRETHKKELVVCSLDKKQTLVAQQSLERNYFKYRSGIDEQTLKGEKEKVQREKVIGLANEYNSINPEFKKTMVVEGSFMPKSENKGWRDGLRDFYGDKSGKSELENFNAEKHMMSIHNFNLRNTSKDDKQTLIKHIEVERAYFDYRKQKDAYGQDLSDINKKNLDYSTGVLKKKFDAYDNHLLSIDLDQKAKQEFAVKLEEQQVKNNSLEGLKKTDPEAYGVYRARMSLEDYALEHAQKVQQEKLGKVDTPVQKEEIKPVVEVQPAVQVEVVKPRMTHEETQLAMAEKQAIEKNFTISREKHFNPQPEVKELKVESVDDVLFDKNYTKAELADNKNVTKAELDPFNEIYSNVDNKTLQQPKEETMSLEKQDVLKNIKSIRQESQQQSAPQNHPNMIHRPQAPTVSADYAKQTDGKQPQNETPKNLSNSEDMEIKMMERLSQRNVMDNIASLRLNYKR